jgi:nicotinamide-nucleotide amidase
VGDEVLAGVVVNSNAAMIGELMLAAGLPVQRSFCVGDDVEGIVEVLSSACEEAEVVIITGGLGPTPDDLTHEALARLLDKPLVRDEEVVEAIRRRFAAFGRRMPASNARQADRPEGTRFIPNPYGTAPGVRAEHRGTVLYSMPGVPGEARRMLVEQILPELAASGLAEMIRTRTFHCVGLPESELADRFEDLAAAANPKMAFLPGGGEIRLRFVATGSTIGECEAVLDTADRTVRERVSEFVYGTDGETLEAVVGGMLAERGLTVATAESCTAGLLAARIADVPGASSYLRGALVAYTAEVKVADLREAAGMTQNDFAKKLRTTQSAVARWFRSRDHVFVPIVHGRKTLYAFMPEAAATKFRSSAPAAPAGSAAGGHGK